MCPSNIEMLHALCCFVPNFTDFFRQFCIWFCERLCRDITQTSQICTSITNASQLHTKVTKVVCK